MAKKMTEGRDPETGQFVQGYKGGGRPKGSRNKLGEKFIADAYADWCKHGIEALQRMRANDPSGYVRVIAGILPDKLEVDVKHQIAKVEWVIVPAPERIASMHADPVLTVEHEPKLLANDGNGLADEST
jgi:hypothetical protein